MNGRQTRQMRHVSAGIVLAGLLAGIGPAPAQSGRVTIYRCTDARGALTVQNDVPCPAGSRQDKRVLDAAPPSGLSLPPFPTGVPGGLPGASPGAAGDTAVPRGNARLDSAQAVPDEFADLPAAQVSASERLPPPALYECRTYDKDRYLREDPNAPQRCAPLQTTGLGGDTSMGAGEACEMVNDQCQQLGDDALCDGWRKRLREVQSQLRFGTGDRATVKADFERIARVVRETTCAR